MVMMPRPLRTELTKIATIKIGAIYLITTTNSFSLLNLEEDFTSSTTSWVLTT